MAFAKTYNSPTMICPQKRCGAVQQLTNGYFLAHFSGQSLSCSRCKAPFDLWEVAVQTMQQRSQLFRERGLAFLGARHAFFSTAIEPEQTLTVNLTDHGIPESARILYSVYTPCGGAVLPMEWRSNEMDRPRNRHTISLYGRRLLPEGASPKTSSIDFSVTFIDHSPDEHALSNLSQAYEYFLWDDYSSMVMPAFVAVEDTLQRVLDSMLQTRGLPTAKRVPIEAQLAVLLPLLSDVCGLPRMPFRITEQLVLLRRLRNELGHEGRLKSLPSLEAAGSFLCAAIFAYRYLKLFQASPSE